MVFSFAPVSAQTHRGKASYYSRRATGARTASGSRIHHDSLTCAHRTYPFGTLLKVTNLRNNKTVVVKVTDRGPHTRGRIIDLSYGAARALGMLSQGIAMVEVEKVDNFKVPYRDEPPETGLPDFEFDYKELRSDLMKEISTVKLRKGRKIEKKKLPKAKIIKPKATPKTTTSQSGHRTH